MSEQPSQIEVLERFVEDAANRMRTHDVRKLCEWEKEDPFNKGMAEPLPLDQYRSYARAAFGALPSGLFGNSRGRAEGEDR